MSHKNSSKAFLAVFSFLILFGFALSQAAYAQDNWVAMPPYNTLWPLWSPVLSPVDATTGLPTPIVTSLVPTTVLSVEPALTWDPGIEYPWLLYNTTYGMAYFDPLYGVNFWPPSSLLDSAGAALPLTLPTDYNLLPPTSTAWLQQNVLLANSYFVQSYPSLLFSVAPLPPPVALAVAAGVTVPTSYVTALFPPPSVSQYLTPAALLGLL
ncbi:MAG: hypothetical protein AB1847_08620 [bacterium]